MARENSKSLEQTLLKKLELFFAEPSQHGVMSALSDWQRNGWHPYLFGGLLRDIFILGKSQHPRDIDVVVSGEAEQEFDKNVSPYIRHKNRFGGLRLELSRWQMDVWRLEKTWAFQTNHGLLPSPENLPRTTFLNVEAIVVSIEEGGKLGNIYEHNFFHAIRTKTIDINLEDNPYPALATVRALATAVRIRFALSSRLAKYILDTTDRMGIAGLISAQETHYGQVRFRKSELDSLIRYLGARLERFPDRPISFLPLQGEQLSFKWKSAETSSSKAVS